MKDTLYFEDNVLIKAEISEETLAQFRDMRFEITEESVVEKEGVKYLRGTVESVIFDKNVLDKNIPITASIIIKTGVAPVKFQCSAKLAELKDIVIEPGTLVYNYMFNYFGGQIFKDKIIGAASIDLAIRVFKDGQEVKFEEAPMLNGRYCLSDIFKVSFNREKLFIIEVDEAMLYMWRTSKDWNTIIAEVVGYGFDYFDKLPDDLLKDMPDEIKELGTTCLVPMEVTEDDFKGFLQSHLDDFDISDNRNAQVPSFRIMVQENLQ